MPSRLLATLILSLGCSLAHAGAEVEAMKSCLISSTSAAEKSQLARWIFGIMGAHPDVSDLMQINETTRIELDKAMARISENLLTERCRKESVAAIRVDDKNAVEQAFGALGEAAMTDLMTNRSVVTNLASYVRYVDAVKIAQVMIEAKIPAK